MATTNLAPERQEDADALTSLEERIVKAVQLVNQLRQEKEAAERKLEASTKTTAELEADNLRLMEEVENLQNDRKTVRTRIEKLLGQIDQLSN